MPENMNKIKIFKDDNIRAPQIETRAEFGAGDVIPVFLATRGWAGEMKVFLKAPASVKVSPCLPGNTLKVKECPASTLCWEISVDKPMSFELTVTAVHKRWTWEIKKKVTAYRLHRLGIDPTIGFFMIRYHEDEAGYLARENWPKVCAYRDEYPLERALQDFKASKINALIMTGSSGSMLKEDYIETEWFTKYVRGCHAGGMRVGICVPFADTYDNYITTRDPDAQDRTHKVYSKPGYLVDGMCVIEGRVASPEMDAPAFVDYVDKLTAKSRNVGVDIIDYAEPEYRPNPTTGHSPYLKRRWRLNFMSPFPQETSPEHRLFMEDCRVEALVNFSRHIHALGMADHLTASPFAHQPPLKCQNYGKYSLTPITELSNTYHNAFGTAVNRRLQAANIPVSSPLKPDSIGCIETRFMGQWEKRHGVYINHDQVSVIRDRINLCAFLHNMDIFLWVYPAVTGKNVEGITSPAPAPIPAERQKRWDDTKKMFSERFGAYLGLIPEYHSAEPYPHIFMGVSKRLAYFTKEPWIFDSTMYRNGLRLINAHLPFGIIWPEFTAPLLKKDTPIKVLMLGEDVPVSDEFLRAAKKWHGNGKALLYFGGPSYDWENGRRLKTWPAILEGILKPAAKQKSFVKETSLKELLLEYGNAKLPGHESNPIVTVAGDRRTGFGIRVDSTASAMTETAYAMLVETVAKLVDTKTLDVKTSGNVEVYVQRNKKTMFISVFNHGTQETGFQIDYNLRRPHTRMKEIISGRRIPFEMNAGRVTFDGSLKGREAAIYRLG